MDKEVFYIKEQNTILEAMQMLDKNAKKTLFVQEQGILKAAVTDGDIRRWILKGGDLQAEIRYVANYQPMYLREGQVHLAYSMMRD